MATAERDYYELLGVGRSASDAEIKKAFRKLARELHPDVSKEADAQERFRAVAEAYEVLSKAETRQLYDRYGHAGLRRGGYTPADFNFSNLTDIFSAFFGDDVRHRARRLQPAPPLPIRKWFVKRSRRCSAKPRRWLSGWNFTRHQMRRPRRRSRQTLTACQFQFRRSVVAEVGAVGSSVDRLVPLVRQTHQESGIQPGRRLPDRRSSSWTFRASSPRRRAQRRTRGSPLLIRKRVHKSTNRSNSRLKNSSRPMSRISKRWPRR